VGQQQLTLRARVENLFDESYWSSVGGSGDSYNYLTLGSPRTLSLNATLSF
jgi:iron complex outermembrane receptor protein